MHLKSIAELKSKKFTRGTFFTDGSKNPMRGDRCFWAINDVSLIPVTTAMLRSQSQPSEIGSVATPCRRSFSRWKSWTVWQKRRRDSSRSLRHPTRCKRWASSCANSFNGHKVILAMGIHRLTQISDHRAHVGDRQWIDSVNTATENMLHQRNRVRRMDNRACDAVS